MKKPCRHLIAGLDSSTHVTRSAKQSHLAYHRGPPVAPSEYLQRLPIPEMAHELVNLLECTPSPNSGRKTQTMLTVLQLHENPRWLHSVGPEVRRVI